MTECRSCGNPLPGVQTGQTQCPVCGAINDTSGVLNQEYYQQDPGQQAYPQQTYGQQPQPQQDYPSQPYQQVPAQQGYYQKTPGQYQVQQGYFIQVPRPGYVPVRGGEAIGTAFRIYGRHFGTFFSYWLLAGVVIIGINFLPYLLSMGRDPGEVNSNPVTNLYALLPLFSYALLFLFSAGIISMTREALEKGTVSFRSGFAPFRDNALMIILTTIAVYLIIMLGMVLCLIPGLVFCYWYFFAVTAVVLEYRSVGDALRRSKEFSQDHGALGFIILLCIVEFLLAILLFGVVVAGWSLYYGPENFLLAVCYGILLSPVLFWFVSPIGFIATGVYFIKGTGMVRDGQVGGGSGGMYQQLPVQTHDQVYQQYYQPPQ